MRGGLSEVAPLQWPDLALLLPQAVVGARTRVPPGFGDPFVSQWCAAHRFLPPAALVPARGLAGGSQIWPGGHTSRRRINGCSLVLQFIAPESASFQVA